ADLRVYQVAYSEDGSTNLVANPRFGQDLDGWAPYGSGSATVVASDQESGRMLRLQAHRNQSLSVDSARFAVTPGAPYRFAIEAGIPDRSAGTAYAAVIFLAESESERQIVLLDPAILATVSVTANASGEFEFALLGLQPGRYRLHDVYLGDL